MKKNYNVTGEARKQMVQIISGVMEEKAVYTRMPECAYMIGGVKVTKDGAMIWEEETEAAVIERIETALMEAGFTGTEVIEETDENTEDEQTGLTISFPAEGFTEMALANLRKLIAAKASLIKKALNADTLEVITSDDLVSFPWWNTMPEPASPTDCLPVTVYTQFLAALVRMAKEAKRVEGVERPTESEKYSMRIFLIRLGFGGAEGKTVRRELLKNPSGHSAFKNQAEADKFYERRKGMKTAEKADAVDAQAVADTVDTFTVDALDETVDVSAAAESEVAE